MRKQKWNTRVLVAVFMSLIIASMAGMAWANEAGNDETKGQYVLEALKQGAFVPVDEPLDKTNQVQIGIYPINVYNLDYSANTYNLSAYVWYRWTGDTDPSATMEIVNVVEEWGLMKTPIYETPKKLPDGSNYQILKVNGMFYQPFELHDYPVDRQKLTINFEDTTNTFDQLIYVPDKDASGFDASLVIPGWDVERLTANTYMHDYVTNFGDTSLKQDASKYTSLVYAIEIKRNTNYFVFKLLLPLMIVLMTNWIALILRPDLVEVRTAMPATALLTIIFLQMSFSDSLPQVSYLVLMDKIYVIVYVLMLATLLQIVWANRLLKTESPAPIQRIERADRIAVVLHIVIFAGVLAYLLLA